MFTVSGQYILPPKREAEKPDTHQYIRKHERDENSPKNKRKKHADEAYDLEDRTNVSVDALYSFLESLIKDNSKDEFESTLELNKYEKKNRDILEEAAFITFKRDKNNSRNAQAASAYAHAAETSPKAEIRQNSLQKHDGEQQSVSDEDKILIQDLLQDLKVLQNNNIREFEVERAGSFLESLQISVHKQINQISSL